MVDIINPLYDTAYPARTITYTGTAGVTGTWPAGPQAIYLFCTTAAHVSVGEGVTATIATGIPIPANTPVVLKVPGGTGALWRVSAIQIATGGSVYAKPINRE
tara:strand:+ start:149 stop:457 length:309 start_codon:yes stop_codon:yes gene_type:complete